MSAPAAQVLYGNFSTPTLIARKPKQSYEGLDSLSLTYVCNDEYAFREGQTAPGYSAMLIKGVDKTDLAGGLWELTLDCEGVLDGKLARRIAGYPKPSISLDDWDAIEDAWITGNANLFATGARGSYGGNTVCTVTRSERIHPQLALFKVYGTFKGILKAKPRIRVISVNGQTFSGDSIVLPLPGGWNTPRKASVQLAKVVCKDIYFGTTPPPTNVLPGNRTPIGAPPVKVINVTGEDVTQHWPGGWHLAGLSGDELGQSGLYRNEWIYEFNHSKTP